MIEATTFPIVGIGASAGGIEALSGFLKALPAPSDLAFVVVTHLGPGRESPIDEILRRHAAVPVEPIRDGTTVAQNRVYVLTEDAIVTLGGGRLHLHHADPGIRVPNVIDTFFGSLAESWGDFAIGIVLSGGGSDGTFGLKAIKDRGGLTMAQGSDGTAPRFGGMPGSAIASGFVDLVVPVEDMPAKLIAYAAQIGRLGRPVADPAQPDAGQFHIEQARRQICQLLLHQLGHDFEGYKSNTFLRRVERRMQVLQVDDIARYVERLQKDAGETRLLFQDLLIGVTNFFRDQEAFEALEQLVLPKLFEHRGANDTIRVWVPGCSTGEEAYSLAMLLLEYMDQTRPAPKVQVFASDIDELALTVARTARYPAALMENVSPERRQRFYTSAGGGFVVNREVRDLCIFSTQNITRDPPLSRIDLVSCRNLLIYFGAEMQQRIMPILHYALRPRGYLFLGVSEHTGQFGEGFAPVDKRFRIFQRRDLPDARITLPRGLGAASERFSGSGLPGRAHPFSPPPLRQVVEARVLEQFAPAHIVVNGDGEISHYSSRIGKYLEPAAGAPSRHLLSMARRRLRPELRTVLREAMQTRRVAVRTDAALEIDDRVQYVTLTAEPLESSGTDPLFLVVFTDQDGLLPHDKPAARSPSESDPIVEHLERELRETRDRLLTTIEEYETAMEELKSVNEELLSLNEEMQSANEELETSKEELQSLNEELQTVNSELTAKLEELDRANSDLRNLFESVHVATVFLDQDLVIRSFTPATSAIFNLIPSDAGRPLTDLVSNVDYHELAGDLRKALAAEQPLERRVTDRARSIEYLARTLPYRDGRGAVCGVTMTFLDVTSIIGEQRQRSLVAELNHRVKNMQAIVSGIAAQTVGKSPSPEAVRTFLRRLQALGRTHDLLAREQWVEVPLREIIETELAPYRSGLTERASIAGLDVMLPPKFGLSFGMIAHELATNAAKYGALAAGTGHVSVSWNVQANGDGKLLAMDWIEQGGPIVSGPGHTGFGTRVIEGEIQHGLGGAVEFSYLPEGLRAEFRVPLPTGQDDAG